MTAVHDPHPVVGYLAEVPDRRTRKHDARFLTGFVVVSCGLLTAVILGTLALAGNGRPPVSISVAFTDGSVRPARRSVGAGLIDLNVTNTGTKPHGLLVVQTALDADHLPVDADNKVDGSADGVTKVFESNDPIAVGDTTTLSIALIAGDYVLIGNQSDDYQAGMRTAFTVTPAATPPAVDPVTLRDFAIDGWFTSSPAGLTDFSVADAGPTAHEFLVFRTDLAPDKLPLRPDGRMNEEGDGVALVLDSGENIDVGTTKVFHAAFTAGHYVLVCNLQQHYKLGMYAAFTVT